MISLSAIVLFLLLAFLNALFAVQGTLPPDVLRKDKNKFTPWFFKMENFYRGFLVNLSFAGISLAMSDFPAIQTRRFVDLGNPMLWIVVNVIFGLLVTSALRDDDEEPIEPGYWRKVICWLIVGLFVFGATSAVVALEQWPRDINSREHLNQSTATRPV